MFSDNTDHPGELAGLSTEPAVFVQVEGDCPAWPAITDPGPAVGQSIYCSHCGAPHLITGVVDTFIATNITVR
jgi:hypothetical protein